MNTAMRAATIAGAQPVAGPNARVGSAAPMTAPNSTPRSQPKGASTPVATESAYAATRGVHQDAEQGADPRLGAASERPDPALHEQREAHAHEGDEEPAQPHRSGRQFGRSATVDEFDAEDGGEHRRPAHRCEPPPSGHGSRLIEKHQGPLDRLADHGLGRDLDGDPARGTSRSSSRCDRRGDPAARDPVVHRATGRQPDRLRA